MRKEGVGLKRVQCCLPMRTAPLRALLHLDLFNYTSRLQNQHPTKRLDVMMQCVHVTEMYCGPVLGHRA